jgi:hypothetical protein
MIKKLMRLCVCSISAAPKPFATLHWTLTRCPLAEEEQDIALTLMIPLVRKMRHILGQRMAEGRFPKKNQPREALAVTAA